MWPVCPGVTQGGSGLSTALPSVPWGCPCLCSEAPGLVLLKWVSGHRRGDGAGERWGLRLCLCTPRLGPLLVTFSWIVTTFVETAWYIGAGSTCDSVTSSAVEGRHLRKEISPRHSRNKGSRLGRACVSVLFDEWPDGPPTSTTPLWVLGRHQASAQSPLENSVLTGGPQPSLIQQLFPSALSF